MSKRIIFIVEGWSDHDKVRNALRDKPIDSIVTNGTKLNNRLREQIDYHISIGSPLFLLTDPDGAGDQLARMINTEYPKIPRIHLDPDKAKYYKGKGKYKYGVEYCSYNYLRELLGGTVNAL